jgi:protein involved in polysaccharide export with SLBB domain
VIRSASRFLACLLVLATLHAGAARAADPNAADTAGMDWSRVSEYRMVPGDKLSIDMGPKPDPSMEYLHEVTIRPDGRITIYPIGDVVAAGLTPMELQKSLIAMLSAELRSPRATVELVSSAANQVHVLGRVQRPGSVPALPFMTVSQAVTAGGGFMDDAARNSVLLIHREGARTVRVTRIRLDRTLKGLSYVDPPISRFDIVYVPRSSIGNMNLFLRQFFDGINVAASTAFTGWELFNLDRVFVTRIIRG